MWTRIPDFLSFVLSGTFAVDSGIFRFVPKPKVPSDAWISTLQNPLEPLSMKWFRV